MPRIDNDRTKGLAVPFLILAHVRTGGTFAAHALSNHPQVYCDRGETLHHLSAWRKVSIPVKAVMLTIWRQDGYHAAGFRAIYRQAFHPEVWPIIEKVNPRIIHLMRQNVTRQGVSYGYQQLVRQGALPFHAVHSFEERISAPVEADPAYIVGYAAKVRSEMKRVKARLADYPGPILDLSYEEMTGARPTDQMEPEAAERICDFLGVNRTPLPVALKCDFPLPMSQWFTNWPAIRRALKEAGFGGLDE